MNCRHCNRLLSYVFLDLGFAPPSNAYLDADGLRRPEVSYPLRLYVCTHCWLVQTDDYTDAAALFDSNYAYFSSTSASWMAHARTFCQSATQRLGLTANSQVLEIASNDGYLLRNFVSAGVSCLGIEPTESTALAAEAQGVPVIREFFGSALARQLQGQGRQFDLVIGNNVYAHVPDINDFTLGMKTILKTGGAISLEFPHLLRMMEQVQFDTVYHEHFSYLSLNVVVSLFEQADLRIFDVQEISTHGGSLRVWGCHASDSRPTNTNVDLILRRELSYGLCSLDPYGAFQAKADELKNRLLTFLLEQKRLDKTVVAYGAAAKGMTLLNYAGVKPDLLPFICDAALSKQNKFTPGGHIPILSPQTLIEYRPDYVLILPWNISAEVRDSLPQVAQWGGRFVVASPVLEVFDPL